MGGIKSFWAKNLKTGEQGTAITAQEGDKVPLFWETQGEGSCAIENGIGHYEVSDAEAADVNGYKCTFNRPPKQTFTLIYKSNGVESRKTLTLSLPAAVKKDADGWTHWDDVVLWTDPKTSETGTKVHLYWDPARLALHTEPGDRVMINNGYGQEFPADENPPGTEWTIKMDGGTKQQFFITVYRGKDVIGHSAILYFPVKPSTGPAIDTWADFNLQVDKTEQLVGETVKLTWRKSKKLKPEHQVFINCDQGYDWPEEEILKTDGNCHIVKNPGTTQHFFIVVKDQSGKKVAYGNTVGVKVKDPGLDKLNIKPGQLGPKINGFGLFPIDEAGQADAGSSYKHISAQVENGTRLRLRWDVTGPMTSIKITGPGGATSAGNQILALGAVKKDLRDEEVVAPPGDCNYVLEAANEKGTSRAEVWVSVHKAGEPWSYHVPLSLTDMEEHKKADKIADDDKDLIKDVDIDVPEHEKEGEEGEKEKKDGKWKVKFGGVGLASFDIIPEKRLTPKSSWFDVSVGMSLGIEGEITLLDDEKDKTFEEIGKAIVDDWSLENVKKHWDEMGDPEKWHWEGKWFGDKEIELISIEGSGKEGDLVTVTIYEGTLKVGEYDFGSLAVKANVISWDLEKLRDKKLSEDSLEEHFEAVLKVLHVNAALEHELGKISVGKFGVGDISATLEVAIDGSLDKKMIIKRLVEYVGAGEELGEFVAEKVLEDCLEGLGMEAAVIVATVVFVGAVWYAVLDAIAAAYEESPSDTFNKMHADYVQGFNDGLTNHYTKNEEPSLGKKQQETAYKQGVADAWESVAAAFKKVDAEARKKRKLNADQESALRKAFKAKVAEKVKEAVDKASAQSYAPMKHDVLLHYAQKHSGWTASQNERDQVIYALKDFYKVTPDSSWSEYKANHVPYDIYKIAMECAGKPSFDHEDDYTKKLEAS